MPTRSFRNCKHPLFEDPEQRVKEIFDEKRKLRLLQVRAESRTIAQNIRRSVAAERERQLHQLEECKSQAKRLWRQQAREQLHEEFNASLAEVGSAHLAAVDEKKQFVERVLRLQAGSEERQRRIKAAAQHRRLRATVETQKLSKSAQKAQATLKQAAKAAAATVPATAGTATHTSICISAHKRKRGSGTQAAEQSCHCCDACKPQPEEGQEQELELSSTDEESESSCDLSDSDADCDQNVEKLNKLCCTPAVVMQLESDDNAELTEPCCMRENHLPNNRQFCSVARLQSPEKKIKVAAAAKAPTATATTAKTKPTARTVPKKLPARATSAKTQFTKATTKAPASKARPKAAPLKAQTQPINKSKPPPKRNVMPPDSTTKTPTPAKRTAETDICGESPVERFSAITDLIAERSRAKAISPRKQKPTAQAPRSPHKVAKVAAVEEEEEKEEEEEEPVRRALPGPKSQGQKSAKMLTLPASPSKKGNYCVEEVEANRNCAARARRLLQDKSAASTARKPYSASTYKSNERLPITASKSVQVQCYDYNNKFTKTYPQPENLVEREERSNEPNAMDMAAVEQQKQIGKDAELERIKKRVEERGQKALEREKIRRDCNDLGAKLDELTKLHGEAALMGNDTNVYQSHRFADRVMRKEANMNAAVEELLNQPVVITCPEVKRTAKPTEPLSSTENFVNISADTDASSSDSCSSSIIEYVDDQRKQLKKDLNTYSANPVQNQTKTEKLKCMLERIEKLRESLLAELKNNSRPEVAKKNVENMIGCIQRMQNERADIMQDAVTQAKQKTAKSRECNNEQQAETARLKQWERRFRESEAILDKKLKEYYKLKKDAAKEAACKTTAPFVMAPKTGEPIEIVIKVTAANRDVQFGTSNGKERVNEATAKAKPAKCQKQQQNYQQLLLQCQQRHKTQTQNQNSAQPAQANGTGKAYDSTSTAYMELPTNLNISPCSTSEDESLPAAKSTKTRKPGASTRVNPMIAQYIQRLLNMPRSAVNNLQVSGSTICTPSSSLVNVASNISQSSACEVEENAESAQSTEMRLERVQRFVEDNRSFIQELEDTLRMNEHESLEVNMRAFEEVWKQRLGKNKTLDLNANTEPTTRTVNLPKCRPARAATEHTKMNDPSEFRVTKAPAEPSKPAAALPRLATSAINVGGTEPQDSDVADSTEPKQAVQPENAPEINTQETLPENTKRTTQISEKARRRRPNSEVAVRKKPVEQNQTEPIEQNRSELVETNRTEPAVEEMSRLSYTAPAPATAPAADERNVVESTVEEQTLLRRLSDLAIIVSSIPSDTQPNELANNVQEQLPRINSIISDILRNLPEASAATRRQSQDAGKTEQPMNAKTLETEKFEPLIVLSDMLQSLPPPQETQQAVANQTSDEQKTVDESLLSQVLRKIVQLQDQLNRIEAERRLNGETTRAAKCQNQKSLEEIHAELKRKAAEAKNRAEKQRKAEAEREVEACLRNIEARHKQRGEREAEQPKSALENNETYSFSELYRTDAYYHARKCGQGQEVPCATERTPAAEQNESIEEQATRYAELTQNCNERIVELNKLLCKVRSDKQKLMEQTRSSISDTVTPSTEHVELPKKLSPSKAAQATAVCRQTKRAATQTSTLQQHKQLGASLDSGIGASRPVTALAHDADLEQPSLASTSRSQCRKKATPVMTTQQQSPQLLQPQKQLHDLSTIPEAETSLAAPRKKCDRSTQQTSSAKPKPAQTQKQTKTQLPQYAPFPTFQQYMEQMPVDVTQLNPEVSMRLEQQYHRLLQSICDSVNSKESSKRCSPAPNAQRQREYEDFFNYVEKLNLTQAQLQSESGCLMEKEFEELMQAVAEAQGNCALDHRAFPTLTAYLQNITAGTACSASATDGEPETINQLLEQLRQANLTIRRFPPYRDYVRQQTTNTPEDLQSLLGTASLDNLSTCTEGEDFDVTVSDSQTLANIETELRRRNLHHACLQLSSEEASGHERPACGAATGVTQQGRCVSFPESGLERLCTTDYTTTTTSSLSGALERELAKAGIKWPETMRKKKQQTQALSSSTTTTTDTDCQEMPPPISRPLGNAGNKNRNCNNSSARSQTKPPYAAEGNPLNLCDFLTRELLKNTNTSSSSNTTSSTADSIREEFRQSVLSGLRTPINNGAAVRSARCQSQNTQQRTSTPVNVNNANPSNRTNSNASTTQLFSGSALSSVPCGTRSGNEREAQQSSHRKQCKRD